MPKTQESQEKISSLISKNADLFFNGEISQADLERIILAGLRRETSQVSRDFFEFVHKKLRELTTEQVPELESPNSLR